MRTEPITDCEVLRLGAIYQQLLYDLDPFIQYGDRSFDAETQSQQLQLVSDAVGQALQLLSARCSRCDADCVPLCPACFAVVNDPLLDSGRSFNHPAYSAPSDEDK